MIVASKDISDRMDGDGTQEGDTHNMVHTISTVVWIAMVLLAILVLGGSVWYFTRDKKPKGTPVENKSLVKNGEEIGKSLFKNLRY